MSELVAFTRYVGLVVVLTALLLLAPRMTVALWQAAVHGVQARWSALLAWRPGTVVVDAPAVPVEVRVGERRAGVADEVLETGGLPGLRHTALELWVLARDWLEGAALALATLGLVVRSVSDLLTQLPEAVVLAGDLLLVLGAFLVMQRTIRDFDVDALPRRLAGLVRPERVRGRPEQRRAGRVRHVGEMLLLAPAFVALLAWPVEVGRFVADKQFAGPRDTVLVVWACELPWLVALTWWLARPLLPPLRRSRGRHAAPVVALRRRQQAPVPERRAA